MNLGQTYLDHYATYLGTADPTMHTRVPYDQSGVQLFDCPGALPDTHVLVTLGLTHFQDRLRAVTELIFPVSVLDGDVLQAAGASVGFLLQLGVPISEITTLRHLHRTAPDFARRFGKTAVTFVPPFPFPEAFVHVPLLPSEMTGAVWMAVFLSDAEVHLSNTQGFDALADALDGVDVIDLSRPSSV